MKTSFITDELIEKQGKINREKQLETARSGKKDKKKQGVTVLDTVSNTEKPGTRKTMAKVAGVSER